MFSGFPKESREQLSELVTSSGGTVLTGLSPPQLASPEALAAVAATIAAMHPAAAAARDVQGLEAKEAGAGAAKAEVVGAPRQVSRGELGGLVHWLGREGVGRCVGGSSGAHALVWYKAVLPDTWAVSHTIFSFQAATRLGIRGVHGLVERRGKG